jgi:hypothetical protein
MKHQRKIYYSIQNYGDGSAGPSWFDTEELAELDQELMDEGWGEPCTGWLTVESDSPINVLDEIMTLDKMVEETEREIKEIEVYRKPGDEYYYMVEELQEKLVRLNEMYE